MPREGTRSQTGNSKPRVLSNPDTAPVIARKPSATSKTKKASAPAGVKKTPAQKTGAAAAKAKTTANKVTKQAAGAAKGAKKATTTKTKTAAAGK